MAACREKGDERWSMGRRGCGRQGEGAAAEAGRVLLGSSRAPPLLPTGLVIMADEPPEKIDLSCFSGILRCDADEKNRNC